MKVKPKKQKQKEYTVTVSYTVSHKSLAQALIKRLDAAYVAYMEDLIFGWGDKFEALKKVEKAEDEKTMVVFSENKQKKEIQWNKK